MSVATCVVSPGTECFFVFLYDVCCGVRAPLALSVM